MAMHHHDNMFFDYYGRELTSSALAKILNGIFAPKKISVNMLRHIYITEKEAPLIAKLEAVATDMAHSTGMQKLYVKHE
jgi:hypothetical protein